MVFRTMVTAGYRKLIQHKDELNKINVFPIPDADTGNNMKIALRSGVLNQVRAYRVSCRCRGPSGRTVPCCVVIHIIYEPLVYPLVLVEWPRVHIKQPTW